MQLFFLDRVRFRLNVQHFGQGLGQTFGIFLSNQMISRNGEADSSLQLIDLICEVDMVESAFQVDHTNPCAVIGGKNGFPSDVTHPCRGECGGLVPFGVVELERCTFEIVLVQVVCGQCT